MTNISAADSFQRAAFANFEFPVSRISIRGGLRKHVHEYPHSPGGAPEKLGRKLYTIEMHAPMHTTLPQYPTAYPDSLASLMIIFEGGKTFDLVVPTIGTIPAYATEWERDYEAKRRSGEDCKFTFEEDQSDLFLVTELIKVSTLALQDDISSFEFEAEPFPNISLFASIIAAVNSITSIADQVELYGNLIEAKALGIASLCEQADHAIDILNHPVNFKLLDALHQIHASALALHKNVLKQAKPTQLFTVTANMPISQVAAALYGDSARAAELLRMNAVNDAFAIPKGTVLKAYKS